MNRISWTIAAFLILAGLLSVYFNRNANKELMPFLGKWIGGYTVSRVAGKAEPEANKRNSLTGFLQLYGAKHKFEMRLSGEQQEIVVKGNWTLDKDTRISLKASSIDIEDFGGADKRDPNLVYIPNDDVRAAYGKTLILDLSADKKRLRGLLSSIGELTGAYDFERVGSGR